MISSQTDLTASYMSIRVLRAYLSEEIADEAIASIEEYFETHAIPWDHSLRATRLRTTIASQYLFYIGLTNLQNSTESVYARRGAIAGAAMRWACRGDGTTKSLLARGWFLSAEISACLIWIGTAIIVTSLRSDVSTDKARPLIHWLLAAYLISYLVVQTLSFTRACLSPRASLTKLAADFVYLSVVNAVASVSGCFFHLLIFGVLHRFGSASSMTLVSFPTLLVFVLITICNGFLARNTVSDNLDFRN